MFFLPLHFAEEICFLLVIAQSWGSPSLLLGNLYYTVDPLALYLRLTFMGEGLTKTLTLVEEN